ncbi:unnamed protein product [Alopecurus aequalis]
MASSSTVDHDDADRFDVHGPAHIMSRATANGSSPTMIDWNNEEDRRCVAACVVRGTYILEKDRTGCRVHPGVALAPPWWESFNFRLLEVLKDDAFDHKGNMFIFGAIYEHASPECHPSAPQYIVAFRGTMPAHPKAIQAGVVQRLGGIIFFHQNRKRARLAREAVEKLLATAKGKAASENCAIWLTGHSLGASLALDVGRAMMCDQGLNLPTFLFNPPQVSLSPAINMLLPLEGVRKELHVASNLVKAGIGLVLSPHRKRMARVFERLAPWAPNLYVHEKDIICQGFVHYFEHRQHLHERFSRVAKSAMTLSYRDMLFSALGKDKERPHLLSSATLWKNSSMDRKVHLLQQPLAAHKLQQWWKPDGELKLTNRCYTFP